MALLLTEADVLSLLTMDLALLAVEAGFRGMADATPINLPRRRIAMEGSTLHPVLPISMVGNSGWPNSSG
jgi:hypothetical protein